MFIVQLDATAVWGESTSLAILSFLPLLPLPDFSPTSFSVESVIPLSCAQLWGINSSDIPPQSPITAAIPLQTRKQSCPPPPRGETLPAESDRVNHNHNSNSNYSHNQSQTPNDTPQLDLPDPLDDGCDDSHHSINSPPSSPSPGSPGSFTQLSELVRES